MSDKTQWQERFPGLFPEETEPAPTAQYSEHVELSPRDARMFEAAFEKYGDRVASLTTEAREALAEIVTTTMAEMRTVFREIAEAEAGRYEQTVHGIVENVIAAVTDMKPPSVTNAVSPTPVTVEAPSMDPVLRVLSNGLAQITALLSAQSKRPMVVEPPRARRTYTVKRFSDDEITIVVSD